MNTPSMRSWSRRGRRGSPSASTSSQSRKAAVFGLVADGDEQALEAHLGASPVIVSRTAGRRPWRRRGPPRRRCSGGSRSWGARSARSTMILLARNVSRRWSRWTLRGEAGQVVAPPRRPCRRRRRPRSRDPGRRSRRRSRRPTRHGRAGGSRSRGPATSPRRRWRRRPTAPGTRCRAPRAGTGARRSPLDRCRRRRCRVPKRSAWARIAAISSGPWMPVGEARVVLDVARQHQLAARRGAGQDDRLEVGPGRVDRGGQAGRAGADDQQLGVDAALAARRRSSGRRSPSSARRARRRSAPRPPVAPLSPPKSMASPPNGSSVVVHGRYRSTFAIPPGGIASVTASWPSKGLQARGIDLRERGDALGVVDVPGR